jgi:hypothetical protein
MYGCAYDSVVGLVFDPLIPPRVYPGLGLISGIGEEVPELLGEKRRELKPCGKLDASRENVIRPVDKERCSSCSPMVYPER